MYYNIPNINRYLHQVVKYRKPIILFYIFLAITLALIYQPKFLSSDELFWLNDSKELKKTNNQQLTTYSLEKLIVHIDKLDDASLEKLKQLHQDILKLDGVTKVSSIFSNDFIETQEKNKTGMVVVINSSELDSLSLKKLVKEIRAVLNEAIGHNGTTISNYRRVDNKTGGFQNFLKVYQKSCCPKGHPIDKLTQAGRSTYFCPVCQKKKQTDQIKTRPRIQTR